MTSKKIMAELYANKDLSADEYIKKPFFSEIESSPEIIERLEQFHLPEITKAICCSDSILSLEWARKYLPLRDYCIGSCQIKLESLLDLYEQKENGITKFENDYIMTGYAPIIKELCDQSRAYYDELDSIKAKIKDINAEIDKIKAKQESDHTTDNSEKDDQSTENATEDKKSDTKKTENNKELNSLLKAQNTLEEQLNDKEAFAERFNKYLLLLNQHYSLLSSDEEDRRRKEAYKFIEGTAKQSDEDRFVATYKQSGNVTDEFREKLINPDFCRKFLNVLGQRNSQLFAIPFLVHLHNQAEIDIETELYKHFLYEHSELLVPYLIEEYNKRNDFTADNTNKALLEILLSSIIVNEKTFKYAELFNQIQDADTWKYIFTYAISFEKKCHSIALLLNGLRGKPVQYMFDFLSEALASDIKVSVHDICEELLKLGGNNNDIVLRLIGLLEQNQRKIQRKLNTTERIVKSQSQEIFSNLYSPMQDLEDLTASIKDTNDKIDCNLVAGRLFTVVEELRSGLTSLGVEPVEDYDSWRRRIKIPFDSQKHKAFLMNSEDEIAEVKIRTLGFLYTDDEGIENKILAEVCIDEINPDNPVKKGDGYPKGYKINSSPTPKGIKKQIERRKKNKGNKK